MIDRRKTGVNRVQLQDGNGGKLDVYTMTANRIKVWAVTLAAVLTVCGMVFAAARFGVGIEIHQAIKKECDPPDGEIYREIEVRSKEFLEEFQGVFQDDLDVFDGEQREQGKAIARIETKQIALEEKMDDDKEDLIREIRLAGGGNG